MGSVVTGASREWEFSAGLKAICALGRPVRLSARSARQGRRWWQREHKGAAQERALEKYVHRGMLDVLHRVLRIEEAQGISAEAFAGLVQAAGEEEGLLPLEDASMDDWAPLSTLRGMMLEVCGSMGRMWAEIAGDA